MNPFLEKLNAGQIMVADGATGTNLQKMGLKEGILPEDLVFDNPDLLLALARGFVQAGSDIILTCTFGGTRLRMKGSRYVDRVGEVNKRAVALARQAAEERPGVIVAGSIGPGGQMLKPYGALTPEEASDAFAEQAAALVEGGVDLLVIETMFALEEALLAFDAARAAAPDLPIVVSFSFERKGRTMMGVRPSQVIKTFAEKGAVMVGANCGASLEEMEAVVREYAASQPGFPIWSKPNAGLPRVDGNNQIVYDLSPPEMAQAALRNIEAGARVVGGCCGTRPEHLSEIVRAVRV